MRAPAALSALCAACVGCAPLASLRPAGGLVESGRSFELGAGAVALGPRPYVIESWQPVGQVWGTLALSRWFELSTVGAFDEAGFAVGETLRWIPLRLDRLALGGELELGFAWAAVALPVALRLTDGVWLYSTPRLGNLGIHLTPGLPAGISVNVAGGLVLRAEAQVSWADFLAYQRRLHLAAGAAYQF